MQKDLQSADKSNEKIAQIYKIIQTNLNSDLVNKTEVIFQFNVKGIRHKLEINYNLSKTI